MSVAWPEQGYQQFGLFRDGRDNVFRDNTIQQKQTGLFRDGRDKVFHDNAVQQKVSLNFIDKIGNFIKSFRPPRKNGNPGPKCSVRDQEISGLKPQQKNVRIKNTSSELLNIRSHTNQINDDILLAKLQYLGISKNKKIIVIIGNRKMKMHKPKMICLIDEVADIPMPVMVKINGDGNCLFRCFSKYCECTQENHEKYRKLAIEAIMSNRGYYEQFINGDFDEHINNMKKSVGGPEIWGTEAEIIALSNVLDMDTFIRKKSGQNWEWLKLPIQEGCNHHKKFITIQYASDHFSLISNMERPCSCSSSQVNMESTQSSQKSIPSKRHANKKEGRGVNGKNLIYIEQTECHDTKQIRETKEKGKHNENVTLVSININGIRGKKNDFAAYLDTLKTRYCCNTRHQDR